MPDDTKPEGWGVIRPGDRKAHFYRGMTSLCRRVGFYQGPLDSDTFKSAQDCAACRKVLDREERASLGTGKAVGNAAPKGIQ